MTWSVFLAHAGRRAVAASLAVLHLSLAIGAAHHAGVHLDDGLDWLPSEFHHHTYQFTKLPDGTRLEGLDPCLACHLSRVAWRLPAAPAFVPEDDVIASGTPLAVFPPLRRELSARAIRAPPLA